MNNPATTKQLITLRKLGIPFEKGISCKDARTLIMQHNLKKGKLDTYSNLQYLNKQELERYAETLRS